MSKVLGKDKTALENITHLSRTNEGIKPKASSHKVANAILTQQRENLVIDGV